MIKTKKIKSIAVLLSSIFLFSQISATSLVLNKSNVVKTSAAEDTIADESTILKAGKYEQDADGLNYVGSWTTQQNPNCSGGSTKYSSTPGAYVEFSFIGTGFSWISYSTPNRGIAKITVDGEEYTKDTSSAEIAYDNEVFSLYGLDSTATHKVKIEVTADKNDTSKYLTQLIDYIQIFDYNPNNILTAGIYEENADGLNYSKGWQDQSNSNLSGKSGKFSSAKGSSVSFSFKGTGFSWYSYSTPNRGIAKVTIDDVVYTTDTSSNEPTYNTEVFSKLGLEPSVHNVTIEVTSDKNANSNAYTLFIDSIQIFDTDPTQVLTAGKYEENAEGINYAGFWRSYEDENCSGGTALYSLTANDYISFNFRGTGFSWYAFATSNRGIANVNIDGVDYKVDTASESDIYNKIVFSKAGLTYGIHKVTITILDEKNENSNSNTQFIDYIEVYNTDPASTILTSGIYEENAVGINYTGTWFDQANSCYSAGLGKYSSTAGDSAEFTFRGTGFSWYGFSTANRGYANVIVDGISHKLNTADTGLIYHDNIYTINNLGYGTHTVKIEVLDEKDETSETITQSIDAIQIYDSISSTNNVLTPAKYEETDANLNYFGGWTTETSQSFSNETACYSMVTGNSVSFTFEGIGFSLYSFTDPNTGTAKITIDGKDYTVDTSTKSRKYKNAVFTKSDLTYGVHTAKVELVDTKALYIDSIEILKTDKKDILKAGKYEENNPALTYVGQWKTYSDSKCSNGLASYSYDKGDYIYFSFEGTGFSLGAFSSPNRGIAKITVDTTEYTQDTTSNSITYNNDIFSLTTLPYGTHYVKFEVTDNKPETSNAITQFLDYVEIYDSTPILKDGIYEENADGIQYFGNWLDRTDEKDSNGASKYSYGVGSYLTFKFQGTGFTWYAYATPNRGIANISIDDVDYTQDTSCTVGNYKAPVFTKTGLDYGIHTVRIEVGSDKNDASNSITQYIDYLQIYESDPEEKVLTSGIYEENADGIQYFGVWSDQESTSFSGGAGKYSLSPESYLTFTFEGTGFAWYAYSTPNRGIAEVTIDDGEPIPVDSSSEVPTAKKQVFSKSDLVYGTHTAKIKVTNNKNDASNQVTQFIDSIEIYENHPIDKVLTPGTYEEDADGIQYFGSWFTQTSSAHSNGAAKYSTTAGSYLTFAFEGTGFSWYAYSTPNRGIAEVTIDGETFPVDTSSTNNLPNKELFTKTGLEYGPHQVKIKVTDNKNDASNNITQFIDSIQIYESNSEEKVLTPGIYEENADGIQYYGIWSDQVSTYFSGEAGKYSLSPGNYVSFTFEGTGFAWYAFSTPNRGIAKVTIDDTTYSIDCSSPINVFKNKVYSIENLPSGKHTVKLEVTANKNDASSQVTQFIDYVEIYG